VCKEREHPVRADYTCVRLPSARLLGRALVLGLDYSSFDAMRSQRR
jgi:hypothetical protein